MPNDDLPYMKLWVGDLFGDPIVRAMDEAEFGLYMLALCYSWQEGSLPADEHQRAKALGVSRPRMRKLWGAIGSKWESDDNGGLVNRRQERERTDALNAHRRRVEAGRKGGLARAA